MSTYCIGFSLLPSAVGTTGKCNIEQECDCPEQRRVREICTECGRCHCPCKDAWIKDASCTHCNHYQR